MLIYCKKCEVANDDTATFCSSCGTALTINRKAKGRPIPYLSLYAVVASTAAVFISCYALFEPGPEDITVSSVSADVFVADRVVARQFLVVSPSGKPSGGFGWADDGEMQLVIDNGQSQFGAWLRTDGAVHVNAGNDVNSVVIDTNSAGAVIGVQDRATICAGVFTNQSDCGFTNYGLSGRPK